jgi:hypothetical protein
MVKKNRHDSIPHFFYLSLSQFLSLIFTWPVCSLFPDPRGVVLRTRPSYSPRGTCPRWADTPAAPGRADSLSGQFLAYGHNGGQWWWWYRLGPRTRNLFSSSSVSVFCVALAHSHARVALARTHLGPPFSSLLSWPPWGRAADTPLLLSKRDVPALGRYPSRAGEGRLPVPTVPSTRIRGGWGAMMQW